VIAGEVEADATAALALKEAPLHQASRSRRAASPEMPKRVVRSARRTLPYAAASLRPLPTKSYERPGIHPERLLEAPELVSPFH